MQLLYKCNSVLRLPQQIISTTLEQVCVNTPLLHTAVLE